MAFAYGASHHEQSLSEKLADAQCACMFSVGKMTHPMYGHHGRERSISATEQFQRKCHKYFDLYCPLSMWQCFHDEQKPQR